MSSGTRDLKSRDGSSTEKGGKRESRVREAGGSGPPVPTPTSMAWGRGPGNEVAICHKP